jgi:hypothetical protein
MQNQLKEMLQLHIITLDYFSNFFHKLLFDFILQELLFIINLV